MTEKSKIEPVLASGFRDYMPEDMIPRQEMLAQIRKIFESFGFAPLDTPGLEKEEILTGGDPNFRMNIYRAGLEGGSDKLALRFDLTVPLARVIAANPNIKKPFKRYQAGNVWRGERPQAGRFREFLQFDADIVGTDSLLADAEIIILMSKTMEALGLSQYLIKVNNRKILNGLAQYARFEPENISAVLRSIDKLDKQGWDKVKEELSEMGLSEEQAEKIKKFVDLKSSDKEEVLKAAEDLMFSSESAMEGISELKKITAYVRDLGISDDKWTIDFSVARGLGYYTGPVFETILTNAPIGSVFSGGRYDFLVERFGKSSVPCTGASVGVDRIFAAMDQLGLIPSNRAVSKVMVSNFDKSTEKENLALVTELREAGIASEIYLKEDGLKDQLSYASAKKIPFVIIIGAEENENKKAKIKNMETGEQIEIGLPEVISKLKSFT